MKLRIWMAAISLAAALPAVQTIFAQGKNDQPGWAFQDLIPGGHRGAVSALVYNGDQILSAGEDGFLEIWNIRTNTAEERFQVSPYRINTMILRPGKPEICLIESDGLGLYRISAWNYQDRVNLFTLRFRDPVNYINYSAGGGFLIAARSGRTGLVFIHPETGELLQSPPDLTGMVNFAATGRSERNMIVYLSGGILSYWDLASGTETGRFEVPPHIRSPIIFGNNRFFAGFDSNGLTVIDAVSGDVLAENSAIPPDSIICAGTGTDFFCVVQNGGADTPEGAENGNAGAGRPPELYRFTVNNTRRLVIRERRTLSGGIVPAAAAAAGDGVALGGGDGGLRLLKRDGQIQDLLVKNQVRIIEAAASDSTLAFLTEGNLLGFIPLDFFRLDNSKTLRLETHGGYTRILPFSEAAEGAGNFLFWQTGTARLPPMIRSAEDRGSAFVLQNLPLRYPLRAAGVFGEKALFLDSAGNISVLSVNTGAKTEALDFSFSSIGSMDVAFIDRDNIMLGRSSVSGNSPFLMINIRTGETVPLSYPSSAGVRVYRGASGIMYAAEVDEEAGNPRTSIIRLDAANPAQPVRLVEYQGEDTLFSLAESSNILASTLGDSGAALFSSRGMLNFERSPGLPLRLSGGGLFFIVIDGDGNICWHDPRSGKLLAIFRLYENEWILQQSQDETVWGSVLQP
ncbi:MAG: WD40 repeat domain-containing protein [Treponema sp.]|nr:WD40 repeat domain-containing protein [Treponema sp.]